jgi:hypothetical protein
VTSTLSCRKTSTLPKMNKQEKKVTAADRIAQIKAMDRPTIPDEVLQAMEMKELQFFQQYLGWEATPVAKRETFKNAIERIKEYLPLSQASRRRITEQIDKLKKGEVFSVGNFETTLWRTGGKAYYTEKNVILVKGTGDVVIAPNTVIPTIDKTRRPGSNAMAVLLGSFLKIQKGKIVTIQIQNFMSRWTRGVGFTPQAYIQVVDLFSKLITDTPLWSTIQDEEQTYSREKAVSAICGLLSQMDEAMYYYLHTFVVFEFLSPFKPIERKGKMKNHPYKYSNLRYMIDGKFKVNPKSYVSVTSQVSKAVVKAIRSNDYPEVMVYCGGVQPQIKVGDCSTIMQTVASQHLSAHTRGSDKTAGSFLSLQIGYSGVAPELVRRLQRGVAMAGGLLLKDPQAMIDIQLSSTGDAEIMGPSLKHYFPNSSNYRFYVDSTKKHAISSTWKPYITTIHRPGAHYVKYDAQQMKTRKATSDVEELSITQANYQKDSHQWAPEFPCSGYTMFETLFGPYPWKSSDDKDSDSLSSSRSFAEIPSPKIPHFVHLFGLNDRFTGIITTQPDYKLFGVEVTVVPPTKKGPAPTTTADGEKKASVESDKKSNGTELAIAALKKGVNPIVTTRATSVDIPLVKTESEWYRHVVTSNAKREAYWCIAKPQYSPVSNVLIIPKSGVTVSELDEVTEITYDDATIHEVEEYVDEYTYDGEYKFAKVADSDQEDDDNEDSNGDETNSEDEGDDDDDEGSDEGSDEPDEVEEEKKKEEKRPVRKSVDSEIPQETAAAAPKGKVAKPTPSKLDEIKEEQRKNRKPKSELRKRNIDGSIAPLTQEEGQTLDELMNT